MLSHISFFLGIFTKNSILIQFLFRPSLDIVVKIIEFTSTVIHLQDLTYYKPGSTYENACSNRIEVINSFDVIEHLISKCYYQLSVYNFCRRSVSLFIYALIFVWFLFN